MLEDLQQKLTEQNIENDKELLAFIKKYSINLDAISFYLAYSRFSSNLQDEKSIQQQEGEQLEYASKNNILIVRFYKDEAKSGKKDTREDFQHSITDCLKSKIIKGILVWKTDRFARKAMDNLFYRAKLEAVGKKLISITQPIANDDSPEGKLMSTLLAGMDQYYSENLASNVQRALKSNAKESKFNGGIPPLRI